MKKRTYLRILQSLALCLSVALAGCSKDDKPKPKEFNPFSFFEKVQTPALKLVNEAGEPLPQAQILIGHGQGEFAGNYGQTDQNGEFAIPAAWTHPAMVTVDAPGYIRATYVGLSPEAKVITLKKKYTGQVQLSGITSGHPIKNRDGFIDFSLVMSAMTRQDLLNFQVQKVVSRIYDTITVVGQDINIPANVSIPRQTESYFIGITLDKPQYRLFFNDKGVQRVFAARGRFPFKQVVDGFRSNKEVFDMINFFTLTGGSIRDVNLTGDSNKLDIPVMDLTFADKKTFKAPQLDSSETMVALTVSDQNGYLIPTDVKRLNSNESVNLTVWNEHPVYLAQVIKNKNEFDTSKPGADRLSAILLPFDEHVTSNYLPLISFPANKGHNLFAIPQVNSDIHKLATYGLISDVKVEKDGGDIKKTADPEWEVYAPDWVSEIQLPEWAWNKSAPATRFEVSLVGSTSSDTIPLGPQMMEKATHVTRSSVEY